MSNKYYDKINQYFENILEESGIHSPNELQARILQRIKQGGDLLLIAPEGKGKTYGALLSMLVKNPEKKEGSPRSLYISDDNYQVKDLAKLLEKATRRKELLIELANDSGNVHDQKDYIFYGADIVVGTPKRVYDLYIKNGINLNLLNLFILDNPDKFLTDKVIGDMVRISEGLPKCQKVFMVQDMTPRTKRLVDLLLVNPLKIEVK